MARKRKASANALPRSPIHLPLALVAIAVVLVGRWLFIQQAELRRESLPVSEGARPRTSETAVQPSSTPPPPALPSAPKGVARIASWNVKWFGHPKQAPADDALQLANAQAVMKQVASELWGLVEISDPVAFRNLVAGLPGYDGLLSSDPDVAQPQPCPGTKTPCYGATEQKLAVVFKRGKVELRSARLVLTSAEHRTVFAGRPPLRVDVKVQGQPLVLIVVHLKAKSDRSDWERRKAAAEVLKAYLDAELPSERVLVVGDFNDDVDTSTVLDPVSRTYRPTPFEAFVKDPARYTFVTAELSAKGEGSFSGHREMLDHHLATNELAADGVPGSVRVVTPKALGIRRFAKTTSDHFPVVSEYRLQPAVR
jgi:endonuclease/exonuclease/phosphatase family metal-dependent hydrolase